MWSDLGYSLPISEGTYWLDNGIIKAFNKKTGELCNLYKYTVDYDLNILIKKHKDYNKSIKCDFYINLHKPHILLLKAQNLYLPYQIQILLRVLRHIH